MPARPETYNPVPTPIATNPRTLSTIPTAGRLNAVTAPADRRNQPTHEDHRGNDPPLMADDPGCPGRRHSGVVAVQGALYFIELALLIFGERHLVFRSRGNRPSTHFVLILCPGGTTPLPGRALIGSLTVENDRACIGVVRNLRCPSWLIRTTEGGRHRVEGARATR